MTAISGSPTLITVQFTLSSIGLVPDSLRRLPREGLEQSDDRRKRASGRLVIEPTPGISVVDFVADLLAAGYQLVGASCQERHDQRDPTDFYYMARFLFAQGQIAKEEFEAFVTMRQQILEDLGGIASVALWQVRAFDNPYFQNGVEVTGQRAWSINVEGRRPFCQPDGQPVVEWEKDENGRRLGTAPIPIKPAYRLRLTIIESGHTELRLERFSLA